MQKKKKPPQQSPNSTGKPRKCAVPWLLVIMLVPNLLVFTYLSIILEQVKRISNNLVQELSDTTSTNSLSTAIQINNGVAIQIRQNVQHIVWTTFIINKMNEKIRSGKVNLNGSYEPSLINEEELYFNLADPILLRMFKDTPLRTSVWLQSNTTSISELSPSSILNLQSTSSLAVLTRAVQLESLNNLEYFSRKRPSLGIQQIFIGYEIDGMLASTGFVFSTQLVDQYKKSTGQSVFDFDATAQPWYRYSLQQNEAISMSPLTDINNLFEQNQGLICQHKWGSLNQENEFVLCNLFQALNFDLFSQNLGSSTSSFFLIEPSTMKLIYYYQNTTTESNDSSSIFSLENTVLSTYSTEAANKIQTKLKEVIQTSKAKSVASINLLALDTISDIDQFEFSDNGQTFVILFQTVHSISKNLNSAGFTISSAYIFANVISYSKLNQVASKLLSDVGGQISITGLSVTIIVIISSLIQIIYSFIISRQFKKPIKHLTEFLYNLQKVLEINKTSRCESSNLDSMQQIQQQDLTSNGRLSNHNNNQLSPEEILPLLDEKVFFLSWDTQQLYLCFEGLLKILTAANQKVLRLSPQAQTKALINLADQLSYFGQFQNHSALGVCHNNIACIHFNRGRFLEALQHFAASIVQAKYELDEYKDNKMVTEFPGGGSTRQYSVQSKRDNAPSILIQGNNNNNNAENLPNIFHNPRKHFVPGTQEQLELESNHFQTLYLKLFNRKYDYMITLYLLIHLGSTPNDDPLQSHIQQPFDESDLHHVSDLITELLALEKYLEFSNGARLLQVLLLKASVKLDLDLLDEANAVIEQSKQLLEEINPKIDPTLSEVKSMCFPLILIPSATTIPLMDDNFMQQQPQQQPKERKSIFRKEQNLPPLNNRNIKPLEKQYLSIKNESLSQAFSPVQIDNSNRSNQQNISLSKAISVYNNNNKEQEKAQISFSNQALVIDSDQQMPSNHQYFNFSKACTQEQFRANLKDERKPTHRESENLLMHRQSSNALITRLPSRQDFSGTLSKKKRHKKQKLFSIVPTKFDTKGNEFGFYHDRNSSKSLNQSKVRRFLSDEIVSRYEFFPDVLSTQLSLIKAEYSIKNSRFYEAAEILTKDLESSQFYMSHVRYIHIQKIAQVFASQNIPCDYLNDFQESFNDNIFFKIAVVSTCSKLANCKRTYIFCKDLISEVLNRKQDKFGLISCRKNLHVSLEIPVISQMSISKQFMLIKNQLKRVYLEYEQASQKIKDFNYYQSMKSGNISFIKNQTKLPQKDVSTIQEMSFKNQFSMNDKINNSNLNLNHESSVQDQGNISMTRNQILSFSQDRSRVASFLNDSSFYEDDEIEKNHPSHLNSQELTIYSHNSKGKGIGSPFPPVEQFDFEKAYLQFFKKNSNPKLTEQEGLTDNQQQQQQPQAQDLFETFIEMSQTKLSENNMTILPSSLVSFTKPVFLPISYGSNKVEKQENFLKQATNDIKKRICTSEPSPKHQEKELRTKSLLECLNLPVKTEKLTHSTQKESYTRAFHLSVRKAIVDIIFEEKSFEMNKILQKTRKAKEACSQIKESRQFDQIKYDRFIVVSTDENLLIQDKRFESLIRCLYYHQILLLVLHLGAEEQFKERRFQNGTSFNQKLVIQFFYSEENLLLFLNNKRDKPFVNTLPLMYEYFQTRLLLCCVVIVMQRN